MTVPDNTIAGILGDKGSDVFDIDGAASVLAAIKKMVESNVGALLVTEDGKLSGIVTERDYLRRVTLEGRTEQDTQVREITSSPLVYVTPDTTVAECMAVMTERRIRHVPVLVDGRDVVGMISIGDLVKFQSKLQSVEITFLHEYIEAR